MRCVDAAVLACAGGRPQYDAGRAVVALAGMVVRQKQLIKHAEQAMRAAQDNVRTETKPCAAHHAYSTDGKPKPKLTQVYFLPFTPVLQAPGAERCRALVARRA